ncbi:porphobilinogen deaminase [Lucifera butyrica]|uniref:Porphobilinogen deaminase n=1 Tax=Lucifera butyrica TaxID=1351585 RepID=A0A498RCR0_9FIRM|nr:hydroxymethylbilane synthase [Lucifera butyrica]VBB08835.1 porphobilinogen deaminase [Lucifera butyrica]
MRKKLVVGTRGSKLALWQANHIASRLRAEYPGMEVELKHIVTTGDKIRDVPLAKIGGKGLFTKELERAMLAGDIDLAVHSLKDMPTELPPGLVLAAVTERENPLDALISPRYGTIDNLPHGAQVGTSSLRRRAQLLHYRPDLRLHDLRGNIDTRLNKLAAGELDAVVLAVAGLRRLGWEDKITHQLPVSICVPAVGQGALALEARSDDRQVLDILTALNHRPTYRAAVAERAYLAVVEGGCQVPVGVYGLIQNENLILEAVILSPDGSRVVRDLLEGSAQQAAALGERLARNMLAAGGRDILREGKIL